MSDAKKLKNVYELIDALGGNTVVARELGIDPRNVGNWKTLNRVSREYAPTILIIADRIGIKCHDILGLPRSLVVSKAA
jgi:hypothetical protein